MTFLKSRSGATRVVGCPDVVGLAPDGYTLPMRVDPNTSPAGAIWIPKVTTYNATTPGITGLSATQTTICFLTIPAQGVSGTLNVTASCLFAGPTANSEWELSIDDSSAQMGGSRLSVTAGNESSSVAIALRGMSATDTFVLRSLGQRVGGSGACNVPGDARYAQLQATFIPS